MRRSNSFDAVYNRVLFIELTCLHNIGLAKTGHALLWLRSSVLYNKRSVLIEVLQNAWIIDYSCKNLFLS